MEKASLEQWWQVQMPWHARASCRGWGKETLGCGQSTGWPPHLSGYLTTEVVVLPVSAVCIPKKVTTRRTWVFCSDSWPPSVSVLRISREPNHLADACLMRGVSSRIIGDHTKNELGSLQKSTDPWEISTLNHSAYCKMPHQNIKKIPIQNNKSVFEENLLLVCLEWWSSFKSRYLTWGGEHTIQYADDIL